jgi:hypothetical protein
MEATTSADASTPASETTPVPIAPAPAGDKPLGARQAARDLASWRHKRGKSKDQQAVAERANVAAPAAEPAQESTAQAGDAGESQAPPGEIESADRQGIAREGHQGVDARLDGLSRERPYAPASIEPPRSWTKEDKELFASLPRETQERLAERERSRDSDLSQRQQKATEHAKALEAERRQAEQTRQYYEAALPSLLQQLQQEGANEFSDIRDLSDLQRLATQDPFRFGKWQVQQMRISAVAEQARGAQQRQESEYRQQFSAFAKRQDELLTEKVPDMADRAKAARLQGAALSALKDIGFADEELSRSYNGQLGLSLRDYRVQQLVHDATMWRDAQAKAKAATTKQLPPVQRPGVSQPRGAAHDAQVQNLTKRLETSGSLKDAAALLRARRAAR